VIAWLVRSPFAVSLSASLAAFYYFGNSLGNLTSDLRAFSQCPLTFWVDFGSILGLKEVASSTRGHEGTRGDARGHKMPVDQRPFGQNPNAPRRSPPFWGGDTEGTFASERMSTTVSEGY
jgi:hypothetical protein